MDFQRWKAPPTIKNAIDMLYQGNVDLLAFDKMALTDEFSNAGFNPSQVVPVMPLFKTPYYVAASLTTSDYIIIKLQQAYDKLMSQHKIELVN